MKTEPFKAETENCNLAYGLSFQGILMLTTLLLLIRAGVL